MISDREVLREGLKWKAHSPDPSSGRGLETKSPARFFSGTRPNRPLFNPLFQQYQNEIF